jgi:hypothetical protein
MQKEEALIILGMTDEPEDELKDRFEELCFEWRKRLLSQPLIPLLLRKQQLLLQKYQGVAQCFLWAALANQSHTDLSLPQPNSIDELLKVKDGIVMNLRLKISQTLEPWRLFRLSEQMLELELWYCHQFELHAEKEGIPLLDAEVMAAEVLDGSVYFWKKKQAAEKAECANMLAKERKRVRKIISLEP